MPTTMTSIAKEADVSIALVSRLLRGDATLQISDRRRRRILEAADRLGGVQIRQRRRKLSHAIIAPITTQFPEWIHVNFKGLLVNQSFQKALEQKGFRLHFQFVEDDRMLETIRDLADSPKTCDGVLISGTASEALGQLLRETRLPHVSHSYHAEAHDINTVLSHVAGGMRRCVEHLQSLGHRKIGYLGPPSHYRYFPLLAALAAAGLTLDESRHCWIDLPAIHGARQTREAAGKAFKQWLETGRLNDPDAPTAFICNNDDAALAVVDVMHQHNLRPGVDLSLVGYDNIEVRGSRPADHPILTTVDNPMDRIGARMAELLLNQILHNQTQIVHERLPAPLIVRETTGPVSQNPRSSSLSSSSLQERSVP